MQSKWPKRLFLALVVFSGIGVAGLVGMDMVLSAPPIVRADLERLPANEPTRLGKIASQDFDTVCVLLPYEKRVPEGARDAALINDFLKTRTYGAAETHWALVTRSGERFALARFERSTTLDIASDNDPDAKLLPAGFEPARCAAGDKAALVKLEPGRRTIVFFGRIE